MGPVHGALVAAPQEGLRRITCFTTNDNTVLSVRLTVCQSAKQFSRSLLEAAGKRLADRPHARRCRWLSVSLSP